MIRSRLQGFTLIEIMVVIMIIGMVATYSVPRFFRRPIRDQWPVIEQDYNALLALARREAVQYQTNHRLVFVRDRNEADWIELEREQKKQDDPLKTEYVPVDMAEFGDRYTCAETIKITECVSNGTDLFTLNKQRAYCYVSRQGLVDPVVLTLERKTDDQESTVYVSVEPFIGMVAIHDTLPAQGRVYAAS